MKLRTSGRLAILLAFGCFLLMPQQGRAIPAFARKYGVKCYTCHTIPPALNKNGYMFKRLGYRMPPDNMDGTKPAPKVSALDKDIRFSLTNSFALLLQTSFTEDKTVADQGNVTSASPSTSCPSDTDQSSSCSSCNLDEAAFFIAGAIPDSGFSYFGHYEMYEDGDSGLEQGFGVYTGGRANSSFFIKAGQMHLQEGEGTRATMFYNLFSDPAYTLTNVDPINVSLDQAPVGVDVGYTWASNYFERVFAVSFKVTNGLNADGDAIQNGSTKNSKDIWGDADYWFGPDGGVTVMGYHGQKDQVQNAGADNEFTYTPSFDRIGVFGNYLFFDKLDILGGFIHGRDDWKDTVDGPTGNYIQNTYRGEVDYYPVTGTAIMARLDRGTANLPSQPTMHTRVWGIGAEHAMTARGNVVGRIAYTQEHDGDPVALVGTTDKKLMVDMRFMW